MSRFVQLTPSDSNTLDPARLVELAGELDVGDCGKVMAERAANRGSRMRHLVRASACYGAATLLRQIAA